VVLESVLKCLLVDRDEMIVAVVVAADLVAGAAAVVAAAEDVTGNIY